MNIEEARELLDAEGYEIIGEAAGAGKTWTAEDIFGELYEKIYSHWLDCGVSRSDMEFAFMRGFEGDADRNEVLDGYSQEYGYGKDLEYAEIAYDDGIAFAECDDDEDVNMKFIEKFDT